MDISSRKQLILTKIVALHTSSGDPVGSHLLQEYLDNITVSTATLRNEMAQLTAMGFLQQPHTSAGRVPTEMGYRYFLNNLMRPAAPSTRERKSIADEISVMDSDPDKAAETAASSLARLYGLGAITTTPVGAESQMSYYELVKIGRYNTAVMGVTNLGAIKSSVCRTQEELSAEELSSIQLALNSVLRFVSAADVSKDTLERAAGMAVTGHAAAARSVIDTAAELLKSSGEVRIFKAGQRNLLKFWELSDKVEQVVRLFEETDGLAKLLSRDGDIDCYVGSELGEAFDSLSMVIGRYRVAGGGHGGLAIVGPVRMDYTRIIPGLRTFCSLMSEKLVDR
ncbi:MAG: heat-inducible transcription repressor HrcA [Oscillospiraceae bacterium]|nr:heat-inducible transcription repressor HrcA [Oscillospiraceae bacterium]MBQ4000459.1 heat-inducible transcription repressor HrcA [Oscillospiraceae bacterium]MBQ4241114.1 heat-inducible transcription repressor HrcA [Oscillospiraceae bacterium]